MMPIAKLNIYDTRVDMTTFMALPVVADYGYVEDFSVAGIPHMTMDNRELITAQQLSPSVRVQYRAEMLLRSEYREFHDAIASRGVYKYVTPLLTMAQQCSPVWTLSSDLDSNYDGGVGQSSTFYDLEEGITYKTLGGTVVANPYPAWSKCFTTLNTGIYECDAYALYNSRTGDYYVYEVGFEDGSNITQLSGAFKLIVDATDPLLSTVNASSQRGEIYLCPIVKGVVKQNLAVTRICNGVASHDVELAGLRFGILRGEYGL